MLRAVDWWKPSSGVSSSSSEDAVHAACCGCVLCATRHGGLRALFRYAALGWLFFVWFVVSQKVPEEDAHDEFEKYAGGEGRSMG